MNWIALIGAVLIVVLIILFICFLMAVPEAALVFGIILIVILFFTVIGVFYIVIDELMG